MNLLLANGHFDATDYPLGMAKDEAEMIVVRQNRLIGTQAMLMQSAMTTTLPFSDKPSASKAWASFKKMVSAFMGE